MHELVQTYMIKYYKRMQEVSPTSARFSQLGDHLRVFRFCGQVFLVCFLLSGTRAHCQITMLILSQQFLALAALYDTALDVRLNIGIIKSLMRQVPSFCHFLATRDCLTELKVWSADLMCERYLARCILEMRLYSRLQSFESMGVDEYTT